MGGVLPTESNVQMTDAGLIGKIASGVGLSGRMDAAAIRAFIGSLTQSQIEALIAASVAALVDSSPGTLDTLNELAAALGDDPNFAATVTNAIAAKASSSITVSAGTGLAGGGDLSANRTLSLANTAVTPGSYTLTSLTVDAQGRITAAANGSGGAGDVVGPASATDNAVARFDATTGKLLQNSSVTISDTGIIASGSYFSCGSGGSFAYVYGASGGSNGLWLASKNTVAGGVVLRDTGSGYDNISMGSGNRLAWTGTGNNGYNATVDVSLARSASNTLSVYTTQTGTTLGNFSAAAITASGLLCAGTYTAGTLPSAAANAYKFANVSDSSVTTFGSTVAGGGSSKVQVFSNGTNWTVCAI